MMRKNKVTAGLIYRPGKKDIESEIFFKHFSNVPSHLDNGLIGKQKLCFRALCYSVADMIQSRKNKLRWRI